MEPDMPIKQSEMMKQLPILTAGGGPASTIAADTPITSFSAPVLAHLISIYKSISTETPFQGSNQIKDQNDFLRYMASIESTAMSAPEIQDLNYPLSSYYISSSHNTYLSGNQLYGEASTQAYTNVLKRGCRCLEIDIWDGVETDSTASSSSDSEEDEKKQIGESKSSRWGRMKAKAIHFRDNAADIAAHSAKNTATQHGQSDQSNTPILPGNSSINQPNHSLKPEPRVLHGHTLTQSVPFRSVCQAIQESAFVASSLPLIVSLEVHASLSQQEVMVDIMKEVWKDHLIDITELSESEVQSLPAPDTLRDKILIKVKWTHETNNGESNDPLDHIASNTTEGSEDNISTTPAKKKKASKILSALSELGVYTRGYSFKQFTQPEATIPTHVFSLSESKVHEMHGDPVHGPAMFDHNRNFLMRVFPRGTRIRSTNVDPAFHWRQGAQMVALNWQKLDTGMMLNEGMFAGLEGWVLKPEGYRGTKLNSNNRGVHVTNVQKHLLDLDIKIYAAQNIPSLPDRDHSFLTKMKPYVIMQLHVDTHGPPGQGRNRNNRSETETNTEEDKDDDRYKRRSITSKSESPDFGGDKISWTNIPDVVDELSFLRVKIKDDRSIGKDELLAWACIRLDRLQLGYRFLHLLDVKGSPSSGALLVNISKRLT